MDRQTPSTTPDQTHRAHLLGRLRRTRRTLLTLAVVVLAVVGLGAVAVAGSDGSTVTRARLERSLPQVFSQVYAQQAVLLGHTGVTASSLHATAMCDKHGPDVADVGPGGDWTCLMGWTDPDVPMPPEGYGKFELNVHSNDCWTAGAPSKLVGFIDLTDLSGRQVTNPAFEFDGCFDPSADDTPTGTSYPSVLSVTSTSLTPRADGSVDVQLSCGTGSDGCRGTLAATAGRADLGTVSFDLREEATRSLRVPQAVPADAQQLALTVTTQAGVGPTSAVTLPLQR